ncbi:MAG: nitronate monooxygenase, partial [Phenylobacterium sp.]|nr:nitronate monooxygenase [Phenylobacterium sp.]
MDFKAFLAALPIPILQAPMVGASSPEMAVAVSEAGGLGALGAGALAPADIEPAVAALRSATDRPFCVNLFINL